VRRHGVAAAIIIFLFALIAAGFTMIVFDQLFQMDTAIQNSLFPVGYYDALTLAFFQDGWYWISVVVIISLSVWLYLRAQESAVEGVT